MRPLDASLSEQRQETPTYNYWRSLDGGATWSKVSLPGVSPASFAVLAIPAYGGHGSYVISRSADDAFRLNPDDVTTWWSADGGVTWKWLPDLLGAEGSYLIDGEYTVIALAPDGTVFAAAQHAPGPGGNPNSVGGVVE